MSAKAKRIVEWIIIGLFIAIVASVASILIYRSVVNSDWYNQRQLEKSFTEMAEKVNETDSIEYIRIELDGGEKLIYDAPADLFDDIFCDSFKSIEDIAEQREIWSQNCVTVFYKDKTATSFFITEDNELYWETILKIECPSLKNWYAGLCNTVDKE